MSLLYLCHAITPPRRQTVQHLLQITHPAAHVELSQVSIDGIAATSPSHNPAYVATQEATCDLAMLFPEANKAFRPTLDLTS